MDRKQIALKLAFDALGLKIKVQTFNDRLILQKMVYLLQASNIDFGFRFGWYLRGPYCPALANDAFSIVADLESAECEAGHWELSDSSKRELDRLGERVQAFRRGERKEQARRLERLASVHFLIDNHGFTIDQVGKIQTELKRNEKTYSTIDIQEAIDELSKHELLPKQIPSPADR